MKKKIYFISCFAIFFIQVFSNIYTKDNPIVKAVKKVSPAVVSISLIEKVQYYSPADPLDLLFFPYLYERTQIIKLPKVGSGFIIDKYGYVLTNSHVVQNAEIVEVTLPDGRTFKGNVIGNDHFTDIALIKIISDRKDFPYVKLGNSDNIQVGEWAIAFGNPFGPKIKNPQPTVTVGVISAKHRDFGFSEDKRIYKDMIQTDAAINPGNSGGPLVNIEGEVIGINTFIITSSGGSEGVGFAIPINRAKKIIPYLKKYGKIKRPVFHIDVQNLTPDIAKFLGYDGKYGVIVNYVKPYSTEYRAGLRRGDIIIKVNGSFISNKEDFITSLLEVPINSIVSFTVFRSGKIFEIKIKY